MLAEKAGNENPTAQKTKDYGIYGRVEPRTHVSEISVTCSRSGRSPELVQRHEAKSSGADTYFSFPPYEGIEAMRTHVLIALLQ